MNIYDWKSMMLFSVFTGYSFVLLFWLYYLYYYPLISLGFTLLLTLIFGGMMMLMVIYSFLRIIQINRFYHEEGDDK